MRYAGWRNFHEEGESQSICDLNRAIVHWAGFLTSWTAAVLPPCCFSFSDYSFVVEYIPKKLHGTLNCMWPSDVGVVGQFPNYIYVHVLPIRVQEKQLCTSGGMVWEVSGFCGILRTHRATTLGVESHGKKCWELKLMAQGHGKEPHPDLQFTGESG